MPMSNYDAILLLTFGGPEKSSEVVPFLERLLHGRPISPESLEEIVARYDLFDGQSPIQGQSRALLRSIIEALSAAGIEKPVYWANRYADPMLEDTLAQMVDDGIGTAVAFVPAPFESKYTRDDYLELIRASREKVGPTAPTVEMIGGFYNHPGFICATAARVQETFDRLLENKREKARLVFSVHGLSQSLADAGPYVAQIHEACHLVAERLGRADRWDLVYQSIPTRTSEPWLGPEIGTQMVLWHESGELETAIVVPIGFVLENMEVVYDLDVEIGQLCVKLGVDYLRSGPVASHKAFIDMVVELIEG
jgi:protoporphyrin/coproporphyrin ferrochelatase